MLSICSTVPLWEELRFLTSWISLLGTLRIVRGAVTTGLASACTMEDGGLTQNTIGLNFEFCESTIPLWTSPPPPALVNFLYMGLFLGIKKIGSDTLTYHPGANGRPAISRISSHPRRRVE